MKLLCMDTSTAGGGSIALVGDLTENVLGERKLPPGRSQGEHLMPAIADLLGDTKTPLDTLTGIALTVGPGSFTGIRIGIATAQGLAFANALHLEGVSTLSLLSTNALEIKSAQNLLACPLLDARKGEIYGALFHFPQDRPETLIVDCNAKPQEFLNRMVEIINPWLENQEGSSQLVFLGDGALKYKEQIEEFTRNALSQNDLQLQFASEQQENPLHPQARNLAPLTWKKFQEAGRKKGEPILPLQPQYIRPVSQEFRPPSPAVKPS